MRISRKTSLICQFLNHPMTRRRTIFHSQLSLQSLMNQVVGNIHSLPQPLCCVDFNRSTENIKSKSAHLFRPSYSNFCTQMLSESILREHYLPLSLSYLLKKFSSLEAGGDDKEDDSNLTPHLNYKCSVIAKILKCSVPEVKEFMRNYSFFPHLTPEIIKEKSDIMQLYGLSLTFVKENPRVFYQTSASELSRRLKLLSENSLLFTKTGLDPEHIPHYLECNNTVFDRGFQYVYDKKNAFEGCQSQQEYLQFRLGCTEQQAEKMMSSYLLKRGVSQIKLKAFIDFVLIEAQLSKEFVRRNMVLCNYSVTRLRKRLKIMQSNGVISERQMVHIWNLSDKKFYEQFSEYG